MRTSSNENITRRERMKSGQVTLNYLLLLVVLCTVVFTTLTVHKFANRVHHTPHRRIRRSVDAVESVVGEENGGREKESKQNGEAGVLSAPVIPRTPSPPTGTEVMTTTQQMPTGGTETDSTPGVTRQTIRPTTKPTGTEIMTSTQEYPTEDTETDSTPDVTRTTSSPTTKPVGTEVMTSTQQSTTEDTETDSTPDVTKTTSRPTTKPVGTEVMTSTQQSTTEDTETDSTHDVTRTTSRPTTKPIGTEVMTSTQQSTTKDTETDSTPDVTGSTSHPMTEPTETKVTTITQGSSTEETTPRGVTWTTVLPTTESAETEVTTSTQPLPVTTIDAETDVTITRITLSTFSPVTTATTAVRSTTPVTMATTAASTTEDTETDQTTKMTTTSSSTKSSWTTFVTLATGSSTADTGETSPVATTSPRQTADSSTGPVTTATPSTLGESTDLTTTATPTIEPTTKTPLSTAEPVITTTDEETTTVTPTTTEQDKTSVFESTTQVTTKRITTMRGTTVPNVIGPLPGDEKPDYPAGPPRKKFFYYLILRYLARVLEEKIRKDIEEIFCPYYRKLFPRAFIGCKASQIRFDGPSGRFRRSDDTLTNVSVSYDVIYDATSEAAELKAEEIYEQSGLKDDIDNGTIEANFTVLQQPCEEGCGEEEVDWCENAMCGPYFTPLDTGTSCVCQSHCKHAFCKNNGICEHSDSGVSCSCRSGDGWNYLGPQCEQIWYRSYTILILSSISVAMVIVVVVIVVFCIKRRRRDVKRAQSKIADKTGDTWPLRQSRDSLLDYFNATFKSPAESVDTDETKVVEATWLRNGSNERGSRGNEESSGELSSVGMSECSTNFESSQVPDTGGWGVSDFAETSLGTFEGHSNIVYGTGSIIDGWDSGERHVTRNHDGDDTRSKQRSAMSRRKSNQRFEFKPTVSNIDPHIEIRIQRPSVTVRQQPQNY
ncbi:uncharacterized protein [Ptychodera flava]|uniref:uncharacterized protein n=1 Tax=Ptychodera flava TaxID=63121 RepID=UPI003969D1F9